MKNGRKFIAVVSALLGLAGCSGSEPLGGLGAPVQTADPASDVAVRTTPVVIGRPARVFIFTAIGARCEPTSAPEITVAMAPKKGELSFTPGQRTTVAATANGTCAGRHAVGTGMYYNARPGSDGIDRFTVTARLATGETFNRDFEVRIEQ